MSIPDTILPHICKINIMPQVVKSQVSTGTWNQGLWRTVPALSPLSYWDPDIFTDAHIPGCVVTYSNSLRNRPWILTRVRGMHEPYAQWISYGGFLHWVPNAGADKSHCPTPGASAFSDRASEILLGTCPWASGYLQPWFIHFFYVFDF